MEFMKRVFQNFKALYGYLLPSSSKETMQWNVTLKEVLKWKFKMCE